MISAMLHLAAVSHHLTGPHIDWAAIAPLVVLAGGALVVLLVGLLSSRAIREQLVPLVTLLVLLGALGLEIARLSKPATVGIAGALEIDGLALLIDMICTGAAIFTVLLSWRAAAPRDAGQGEYYSLLLFSLLGMAILASSIDLITLFIGIELLSIPLYVLCASEYRREGSLESGLKYLIIGSVGSATLVYGLAMIYGATGFTGFDAIARSIGGGPLSVAFNDPLLLGGIGLAIVGFAFKASIAPFHQWTPDVYEGAPTPITAFMATATKAAALGIFLRFFAVAVPTAFSSWAPLLAALAAITIIVGNVGALTQNSLKRMLGYSGVAQAGYMLSGVVVGTQLGASATVLYLGIYLIMNMAAFAVIIARERVTGTDQIRSISGLGGRDPVLAWPLTIAMLSLAGIPGTVGFVGKFQLIHALVDGDYTWLAIVLVIGAMISLGYYLRVVAAMWMGEQMWIRLPGAKPNLAPIAGGSPEADELDGDEDTTEEDTIDADTTDADATDADATDADRSGADAGDADAGDAGASVSARAGSGPAPRAPDSELVAVAVVCAAAIIFFGIVPQPLFNLAAHAGAALTGIF